MGANYFAMLVPAGKRLKVPSGLKRAAEVFHPV